MHVAVHGRRTTGRVSLLALLGGLLVVLSGSSGAAGPSAVPGGIPIGTSGVVPPSAAAASMTPFGGPSDQAPGRLTGHASGPGPDVVAETFLLTNNTTHPGNFLPDTGAYYPFQGVYVPTTGTVWLAASFLVGFNGTHQTETNTLRQPGAYYVTAAYDPVHRRMYAPNYYAQNVTVWDVANHTILAQIPVGTDPGFIAYDNATGQMFVTNSQSNNVSVIDTSSLSISGTIPVGSGPNGVVVDPALHEAIVANGGSNNLTFINTTTLAVNGSLHIPGGGYYGAQPYEMTLDPSNSTLWVGGTGSQTSVAVVDLLNRSIVAQVPVGGTPWSLSYCSDLDTVYVGTLYNVSEVNASSYAVGSRVVSSSGPAALVEDPTDHVLYVGEPNINSPYEDVQVVDQTTFTVLRVVSTGGPSMYSLVEDPLTHQLLSLAAEEGQLLTLNESGPTDLGMIPLPGDAYPTQEVYDPYHQYIWVTLSNDVRVEALSASNYSEVANVSLPPYGNPGGLAVDGNNGTLFVTQVNLPDAVALNVSTGGIVHNLTTGYGDTGIAFDPAANELFLANEQGGNVTVFNATTYAQLGTVPVGAAPGAVCFDAANGMVYVADSASASVSVINASSLTLVANLSVLAAPGTVAIDPVGGQVLVSDYGQNNVSVINGTSEQVVENLTVGDEPTGIAFNGSSGAVYVANNGSGSLSIIERCGVVSCMTLTSFVAAPSALTVGESTNLTVTVQYPIGNVTYRYSGLPAGCSTANVSRLTCAPTANGTYDVAVRASDQTGRTVNGSLTLRVTNPPPVIQSMTIAPSSIYLGNSTAISVQASGGYGWLNYSYSGLPAGCASQNASTLACRPTVAGAFTVTVTVTNAFHLATAKSAPLTVSLAPPPMIQRFTASPGTVYLGNSTNISVLASGGLGWLGYAYSGLPPGCLSSNASWIGCTPTGTGTFTVEVNVTNAYLRNASDNLTLLVETAPHPAIQSFGANPAAIDLSNSTTWTVNASGGYGWLSYRYLHLPAGCSSENRSALTCTPSAVGAYVVTVVVSNAFHQAAEANSSLLVNPPVPPTVTSFTAAPSQFYLGQATLLDVVARGSSLAYAYTGLPPGCGATDVPSFECVPSQVGTFPVQVVVTDGAGGTATASVTLVVAAPPTFTLVSFAASSPSLHLGSAVQLTVSVAGAVGFVVYRYAGLPSGCGASNRSTLNCTPGALGRFNVSVAATDQLQRSVHGNLTIQVTSSTHPRTTGNGATTPWVDFAAAGGALIVAAGAVALLLWRRRVRTPPNG